MLFNVTTHIGQLIQVPINQVKKVCLLIFWLVNFLGELLKEMSQRIICKLFVASVILIPGNVRSKKIT